MTLYGIDSNRPGDPNHLPTVMVGLYQGSVSAPLAAFPADGSMDPLVVLAVTVEFPAPFRRPSFVLQGFGKFGLAGLVQQVQQLLGTLHCKPTETYAEALGNGLLDLVVDGSIAPGGLLGAPAPASDRPWWHGLDRLMPINPQPLIENMGREQLGLPRRPFDEALKEELRLLPTDLAILLGSSYLLRPASPARPGEPHPTPARSPESVTPKVEIPPELPRPTTPTPIRMPPLPKPEVVKPPQDGPPGGTLPSTPPGAAEPRPPAKPPEAPTPPRSGTSTAPGAGAAKQEFGIAREQKVADIVGGKVSNEKITAKGIGSSDLDVLGPNGELIGVGGPHKASDLGKFGKQLQILQKVAEERGVPVKMYLEEGTPQAAIDLAKKKLGESNVIIFPK